MSRMWGSTVDKISRAKEIYQEEGFDTLSNKSKRFLLRKITNPLTERFVLPEYGEYVLRTEDLRQQATQVWELEYEKKLSVQDQRDLIPFADNDNLQFRNLPTYSFKDPFVAEMRNARIIGQNPLPLTADGRIISDLIYFDADRRVGETRIKRRIKSAMSDSPIQTAKTLKTDSVQYGSPSVSTASLVYYQGNNFCLWMERELPKLRGIERYEKETGEKIKLIISDSPPEYVYEALDIIGRDDYIEWDGGPLSVDRLVVPSYPQPYPTTVEWIRNTLKDDIIKSPTNSDWIYISRQRAEKGRQVDNYSEVVQVLEEYGVEPVFLEDMSLQEQIATFQQVDGIIGPHGAGLVGMIWTENLSIIEIFNNVINAPFYILADILDHDYTALTGKGTGKATHKKDQDIIIDRTNLINELDNSMGNQSLYSG